MSGEKVSYSTTSTQQVSARQSASTRPAVSTQEIVSTGADLAVGAANAAAATARALGYVTVGAAAVTVRAGVDAYRKEAARRRVEHLRLNQERMEKGEALHKEAATADADFRKVIAAQEQAGATRLKGSDSRKVISELKALLEPLVDITAVSQKAGSLLKVLTEKRLELEQSPHLLRSISQEVEALQRASNHALEQQVARRVLADRVVSFLKEKGYAQRENFHRPQQSKAVIADFGVPGGGATARISITEDGRLGCRLYHELASSNEQISTVDEQAYKVREKNHCSVLREMNQDLNHFGFSFEKFREPPAEKQKIATIVYEDSSQIKTHSSAARKTPNKKYRQA